MRVLQKKKKRLVELSCTESEVIKSWVKMDELFEIVKTQRAKVAASETCKSGHTIRCSLYHITGTEYFTCFHGKRE